MLGLAEKIVALCLHGARKISQHIFKNDADFNISLKRIYYCTYDYETGKAIWGHASTLCEGP